jgi:hypothetical protein
VSHLGTGTLLEPNFASPYLGSRPFVEVPTRT